MQPNPQPMYRVERWWCMANNIGSQSADLVWDGEMGMRLSLGRSAIRSRNKGVVVC